MKKLLFAFFAVAAMASCKKEKISDPAIPASAKTLAKVNYVYDNGTPETDEYTFDANGRISIIKSNDRTHTFNFISASSLEVTERVNTSNAIIAIRYCELNEKGYVTKMVVKNAVGVITGTYNYTYDPEGYQIANKLTYPNGNIWEDEVTYSDGDIISVKTYNNGVLKDYTELTHDKTRVNKTQLINYSDYWSVPNLFGKGVKHMRSELKRYNASGTLTYHIQIAHELDADGYPVKQTNNYVLQGKQGIFTYTFKQ